MAGKLQLVSEMARMTAEEITERISENRSKKVENTLAITGDGQYNKSIEKFNTLIRGNTEMKRMEELTYRKNR